MKMNWDRIKKYKKAYFEAVMKYGIGFYHYFHIRELYSFFDNYKIFINVSLKEKWWKIEIKEWKEKYDSYGYLYKQYGYKKREQAERLAFEKAFFILEGQLNGK